MRPTNRQPSSPAARAAHHLRQLVQRRLPAGQHRLQEAFTSDHHHPVWVTINDLQPDTFYLFDDIAARAFADAALEWTTEHSGSRLTVSFTASGELRAALHRLQHLASRLTGIRVLALELPPSPGALPPGVRCHRIRGTPLVPYRLTIGEAPRPILFITRDQPAARGHGQSARALGFFSFNPEAVANILDDIDQLLQGLGTDLTAFRQLELLHRTTQQVSRQLDSYSRRLDLLLRRAQRRPDLMTPARFNRVMEQAVAKIEELKAISRRALRSIGHPHA